MKHLGWFVGPAIAVAATLRVLTGCSAAQNHVIAQDALTASQILCVLASSLTNDASIAEACAIDKALIPLVRPFLAVKEAKMVSRCGGADAGPDAK